MNVRAKAWCAAIGLQMMTSPMALATDSLPTFIPKKIIASQTHTCILSTSGHAKCWGENDQGTLGLESTVAVGRLLGTMGSHLPTIDLGTDVIVKDMCAGYNYSCAVTTTGRVKCWGRNSEGELGQEIESQSVGNEKNQMGDNLPWTNLGSDFVINNVQCGYLTACAVNTKGQVKCWGNNRYGQLGRKISGRYNLGNRAGDMGDKLPYLPLPPVKSVALGWTHACAAAADAVYCWGENTVGQLGTETPFQSLDATTIKVKLEDDGVPTAIHALTSGFTHACAEYSAGMPAKKKIKCWGANDSGQLGIGSVENKGRKEGTMGSKLPDLQLDSSNFTQRENYGDFSCALKRNGTVQCWGANTVGELGLGDTVSRGKKPEDLGTNLQPLDLGLPTLALSHGSTSNSACALLINHEIKCWGSGESGQLGYEDNVSRGSSPADMGSNLPFVRYK